MQRFYQAVIAWHLAKYQQMLFLAGPRQVGKTTVSKTLSQQAERILYLNWDIEVDRALILTGQQAIADKMQLALLSKEIPVIIFDEIHKYTNWKNFLKGFFDAYKTKVKIIVTGSYKLDLYREGSDSLMGRYFVYRTKYIKRAKSIFMGLVRCGRSRSKS